jgi:2-amino-4-hydroxy-6-hydroxymethyldihydropteridine diphosphokinase
VETSGRRHVLLDPILIAIGANLPSREFGQPRATCEAALRELSRRGVRIVRRSRWYESAPIPASDQPWFVNGVAVVATDLAPEALLLLLQEVERRFGRQRREVNAARVIDLDIVAYGDLVRADPPPILPHPRMHERAFVLLPLADVAPQWRHPADGRDVPDMLRALPPGQRIRPLAGGS